MEHGGRMLPRWAVLVAVGASCRPAPPRAAVDPDAPRGEAPAAHDPQSPSVALGDDPWAWPGPHCFAYSPRLASYACMSLDATPTEASGEDLTPPSMAETREFVRRRRAAVALGVELVSVHGSEIRTVLDDAPDDYTRVTPLPAVQDELTRRGYTVPITARAVLEADAWVTVGRVELRYSWYLQEGDASFEYLGTVELRCTPDGPVHELPPDDRWRGIGGPLAVVSSAPGTRLHAITFEHLDGGEGYVDVRWYSWLVDEARWCP
jgi:hypothetical protein